MNQLLQFVSAHWAALSFGGLYVLTAAVSALPTPGDAQPVSSKFYEFVYNFAHILTNKIAEKRAVKVPADK